jgi:hypothetical protein
MRYFELSDAERYRIAAWIAVVFTLLGSVIGLLTGRYPPWVGALVWGMGAVVGGAITIAWAWVHDRRAEAEGREG